MQTLIQAIGKTRSDEADMPAMVRHAQADPTAFAPIYHHYVTSVYRYVFSKIGNHMEAEDITAEVFMDALRQLPSYRERGYFTAWLFTIARRRIADFYRQRQQLVDLDYTYVTDGLPPLLAQLVKTELQGYLIERLQQLPDDKQEWLLLRFASGLSYKEIGKVVGKSTAAIKMGINRVLKQLAAELEVFA